jgi:hypothetical protein
VKAITVKILLERSKTAFFSRLNKVNENNLGSEIRVYAPCPSERFPEKNKKGKEIKRPKVELFACKLAFSDGNIPLGQKNTAILFGVNEELERQGLCIKTLRNNVTHINADRWLCHHQMPKAAKRYGCPNRGSAKPSKPG